MQTNNHTDGNITPVFFVGDLDVANMTGQQLADKLGLSLNEINYTISDLNLSEGFNITPDIELDGKLNILVSSGSQGFSSFTYSENSQIVNGWLLPDSWVSLLTLSNINYAVCAVSGLTWQDMDEEQIHQYDENLQYCCQTIYNGLAPTIENLNLIQVTPRINNVIKWQWGALLINDVEYVGSNFNVDLSDIITFMSCGIEVDENGTIAATGNSFIKGLACQTINGQGYLIILAKQSVN